MIGAALLVTLRYAPDELQIEVRDDGDGAPTGDGPDSASSVSRARQRSTAARCWQKRQPGGSSPARASAEEGMASVMCIRITRLDGEAQGVGASGILEPLRVHRLWRSTPASETQLAAEQ